MRIIIQKTELDNTGDLPREIKDTKSNDYPTKMKLYNPDSLNSSYTIGSCDKAHHGGVDKLQIIQSNSGIN